MMNYKSAYKLAKKLAKKYRSFVIIARDACDNLRYRMVVDDTDNISFSETHYYIRSRCGLKVCSESVVPYKDVDGDCVLLKEFEKDWYLIFRGVRIENENDVALNNKLLCGTHGHFNITSPCDVEYRPLGVHYCCGKEPSLRHCICTADEDSKWGDMIHYFLQCPTCGKKGRSSLSASWACNCWNSLYANTVNLENLINLISVLACTVDTCIDLESLDKKGYIECWSDSYGKGEFCICYKNRDFRVTEVLRKSMETAYDGVKAAYPDFKDAWEFKDPIGILEAIIADKNSPESVRNDAEHALSSINKQETELYMEDWVELFWNLMESGETLEMRKNEGLRE